MQMLINGTEYQIAPGADLRRALLQGAILRNVYLKGSNLGGAILRDANLEDAYLEGVDFRGAILEGAILRRVNLQSADLRGADLEGADLRGALLQGADLEGAILEGSNFEGAFLQGATNIPALIAAKLSICAEGEITGYKKLADGSICVLRIPTEAKRSNATGRKCRAEYAVVVKGEGVSIYDKKFVYRVGETVRPTEPFCEDRWDECASGIHFFLTREEAEAY